MNGKIAVAPERGIGPENPARGDIPKIRKCLRCQGDHDSSGFTDRICRQCKASAAWRNGVATTAD
ncbi:hypothetical protein [uncultured Jannaschia sp.]|uniref:hypothetical protein n=1 Tax=uncultured Jannaschia sp. TaxID=293347 RepID=UPI0026034F00|nr:hypothetical protein [uncultured Jannaschia sp.]